MQITVCNRGPDEAMIHVLPQLWFRNTWSWKDNGAKPQLAVTQQGSIEARHRGRETYFFSPGERSGIPVCKQLIPSRIYGDEQRTEPTRTPFTTT